ncbi:hypothetical protein Tco_1229249 [Tanacetum coccineum]
MSHLTRLEISANSLLVKDMMIKLFEIDNERDFRVVKGNLCAKAFDKKGIDPTDYCIRFKLVDSVAKHGGIFGDCGVWVCIFLYRLVHGLSLDVEDPFDVALAYREKMVPKYMKLFIEQHIAETMHFINVMHEQVHSSINRLAQLNVMILEMEAMNDPEEFYVALFCLRDDKRVEYNTLMAVNNVIAMAEEKLTTKEAHLEIMKDIAVGLYLVLRCMLNKNGNCLSLHIDNSSWLHRVVLAFQDKGQFGLWKLANLNLADLYDGLDFEMHLQFVYAGYIKSGDDMPKLDEVVFKIHRNGYFEFDPLTYVNRSFYSVSAFTCDRDIFPTCLYWICSEIIEYKWAFFYCLPNKSLEQGLKLIHTVNNVHSFFADAERSGKIHLYITHKQQDLGRYYLRNIVWVEEDAALRCSSLSPFSTRIKRKGGKTTKEGLRKKAKGEQKMVNDEPVGRKSVQTSRKGKEIMYEFPGPSPTKESQVSVTNYKRAIINGKAKMVEVEDVGLVKPVGSVTKVQRSTAKEILLKRNLPDHRSVLTDPEVNPTSLRRMTKPYSSTCFIANCFITGSRKDGDGDTSFQWSQFTTPCSHLMLLIKDIMTNERPTTQLPTPDKYSHDPEKCAHSGPKVTTSHEAKTPQARMIKRFNL